jgi:uncharacterized LabA/DUF88 family protein
MKKVAILVDGEWFRRQLDKALNGQLPHGVTADVMYRNSLLSLDKGSEELFRILYYDCPPPGDLETNPIDQSPQDFKATAKYRSRTRFLSEMASLDFVAMRLGIARKRGWTLKEGYIKQTITGQNSNPKRALAVPTADDVFLNFEQKGVDMRIGIDVATLALKRIVDRIILISGDTDMIPAMKLARREGVQVALVELTKGIHRSLDEDADLVRCITPVP